MERNQIESFFSVVSDQHQCARLIPQGVSIIQFQSRNSLFVPSSDIRHVTAKAQLSNVLAGKWLSQVPELDGLGILALFIRVSGGMNREDFIVTESVDSFVVEKPRVVDGAMVDNLGQSVVLVCNARVIDVHEAVCASRE